MVFSKMLMAQPNYKNNNIFEIGGSVGKKEVLLTANWHHLHGIGKSKRFKLGYGVRFSTYLGNDKDFVTAPARLTSGETGPHVLFTGYKEQNFDTISISSAQLNYLNAFLVLQYTIFKKIDIGFNIDAIGLTFGGKKIADYYSSKNQLNEHTNKQTAVPTPFNLLLVSDNDLGSLNSELFVRYNFNSKWAIKTGVSFVFNEYTTTNKLRLDNNRFRDKSLMLMLGISFSPFNQ